MSTPDELDARRRVLAQIADEEDRVEVLAIFDRIDWRRHIEAHLAAAAEHDDDDQRGDEHGEPDV